MFFMFISIFSWNVAAAVFVVTVTVVVVVAAVAVAVDLAKLAGYKNSISD